MQTVFRIDLRKVKQTKDGILMLRLAMAVNDIAACNTFQKIAKQAKLDPEVRDGLAMHAVRLQIGHLSAGLDLLKEDNNWQCIEKYIPRLSAEGQGAFELVKQALFDENGQQPVNDKGKFVFTEDFTNRIKTVRDKVTFHYDKKQAQDALCALVGNRPTKVKKIIIGNDLHSSRLLLADALVDREVCQIIWGVDMEDKENLRSHVDDILDWCQKRSQAFHNFGFELCLKFFSEECSPSV